MNTWKLCHNINFKVDTVECYLRFSNFVCKERCFLCYQVYKNETGYGRVAQEIVEQSLTKFPNTNSNPRKRHMSDKTASPCKKIKREMPTTLVGQILSNTMVV